MTSGYGGGTPYDQDSDQNLLNDDEEFFKRGTDPLTQPEFPVTACKRDCVVGDGKEALCESGLLKSS